MENDKVELSKHRIGQAKQCIISAKALVEISERIYFGVKSDFSFYPCQIKAHIQ